MPFNPHTPAQVRAMLDTIGADDIQQLFDEIPPELRIEKLPGVPAQASEQEVTRLMLERASMDGTPLNFLGAGAYEHHIPAAVWEIATRGEFYSAYTPYQAEASQGTLQLIYEYQTMVCGLTGLDVSNASLYEGATALAEAALMAVRGNRKSRSKRILVAGAVNPRYVEVTRNITRNQGITIDVLPFSNEQGTFATEELAAFEGEDIAAVVVQQPNYFGLLEQVDALTDWAHAQNALLITVVNPTSLAVLRPPGEWGGAGADIACGEGQPLGVPLSSGGPYFGFLACRKPLMRQVPGRIVGRTIDADGRDGFVLTLQAREQHIRRSKATSNICTNQGLAVTAATIYMSLLGEEGLARVAASSQARTTELVAALTSIPGVSLAFGGPRFHEAVLRLDRPVQPVLDALATRNIIGGYPLARVCPQLPDGLLVCATETRTSGDIQIYAAALRDIMHSAVQA